MIDLNEKIKSSILENIDSVNESQNVIWDIMGDPDSSPEQVNVSDDAEYFIVDFNNYTIKFLSDTEMTMFLEGLREDREMSKFYRQLDSSLSSNKPFVMRTQGCSKLISPMY